MDFNYHTLLKFSFGFSRLVIISDSWSHHLRVSKLFATDIIRSWLLISHMRCHCIYKTPFVQTSENFLKLYKPFIIKILTQSAFIYLTYDEQIYQ